MVFALWRMRGFTRLTFRTDRVLCLDRTPKPTQALLPFSLLLFAFILLLLQRRCRLGGMSTETVGHHERCRRCLVVRSRLRLRRLGKQRLVADRRGIVVELARHSELSDEFNATVGRNRCDGKKLWVLVYVQPREEDASLLSVALQPLRDREGPDAAQCTTWNTIAA